MSNKNNNSCPKHTKNDGGQDHRYNSGNDRTPAQKEGDEKRTKK
ncbi:MAG: hypothetical protein WCR69_09415 [Sulfuricurvum sp.]